MSFKEMDVILIISRDKSIDFVKSLLVICMIIAHSIQFLGDISNKIQYEISNFVNLTTFSGFMFCFGYVSNIAYLKKTREDVRKKLIIKSIKILIIFYISGIAYKVLISKALNIKELIEIILLFKIPGYSEFLLSFSVLNIIVLLFFNLLKKSLKDNRIFIIIIIISLLSTCIPYKLITINQLGIIVGTTRFTCFPILQYMVYFMCGLYFNENKIKFNIKFFLLSLIGSLAFILYKAFNNELPSRFPPSIIWIVGSSCYIYIYYLVAQYFSNKINIGKRFYFIGENTLYFLLISNLILFTLKYFMPKLKLSLMPSITIGLIILIISYIITYLRVEYKLKANSDKKVNI